jgi:hypothetical protein
MAVMAAIVAVLWCAPSMIALALILRLFGIPLEAFFTFAGALNLYAGILTWCLIAFALGLAHALIVLPWSAAQGFRLPPKK